MTKRSPLPAQASSSNGCRKRDGSVGSQLQVAAVVQQEVAAPVPALVAAQAPLHPRSQRLRVRGIPIVRGYVPHHRRQAKFRRSAQHIRTARAERRSKPFHCFAGGILDDSVAGRELFADTRRPLPEQGGMGHRVIPQQMASLMHRPGNFRTPAHKAAHQEEGRTHLVAS